MKALVLIITLFWVSAVAGWAQQTYSASGDLSKGSGGQQTTPQLQSPLPLKPFAPQGSGVIYEMSEKGLVIISPVAPAYYGYGERFLTTNPFPGALAQDNANERKFGYGGIKVIGFDF